VRAPETTEAIEEPESQLPPPSAHELWLLKLLLTHDDLVRVAAAILNPAWIQHPLARRIVQERLDTDAHDGWQGVAAFMDELPDDESRRLVAEAAMAQRAIPHPEQQLRDLLLRLRNQHLDREMARLMHQAGQPDLEDAARSQLLRQQVEIQRLKREPLGGSSAAATGLF
jgi:hypothetical protein